MTTPSTEEFEAVMARVEEALPAPDAQGNRPVTVQQIEKVEDIIEGLFEEFYKSLVKKAAVELDGAACLLDEAELDALPLGTVIRGGHCLFVRCPHNWLELLSGWNHKNAHVFKLLTEYDCGITVTTPR